MIEIGSSGPRHGRVPNTSRMWLISASVYPTRRPELVRSTDGRRPSFSASRIAADVRPTLSAALVIGKRGACRGTPVTDCELLCSDPRTLRERS